MKVICTSITESTAARNLDLSHSVRHLGSNCS